MLKNLFVSLLFVLISSCALFSVQNRPLARKITSTTPSSSNRAFCAMMAKTFPTGSKKKTSLDITGPWADLAAKKTEAKLLVKTLSETTENFTEGFKTFGFTLSKEDSTSEIVTFLHKNGHEITLPRTSLVEEGLIFTKKERKVLLKVLLGNNRVFIHSQAISSLKSSIDRTGNYLAKLFNRTKNYHIQLKALGFQKKGEYYGVFEFRHLNNTVLKLPAYAFQHKPLLSFYQIKKLQKALKEKDLYDHQAEQLHEKDLILKIVKQLNPTSNDGALLAPLGYELKSSAGNNVVSYHYPLTNTYISLPQKNQLLGNRPVFKEANEQKKFLEALIQKSSYIHPITYQDETY